MHGKQKSPLHPACAKFHINRGEEPKSGKLFFHQNFDYVRLKYHPFYKFDLYEITFLSRPYGAQFSLPAYKSLDDLRIKGFEVLI